MCIPSTPNVNSTPTPPPPPPIQNTDQIVKLPEKTASQRVGKASLRIQRPTPSGTNIPR